MTGEVKRTRDEIGESDNEKEKVEYTKKQKLDLHEELTVGKSEIARLSAALGVTTSLSQATGTLKEQLSSVKLALDYLRSEKEQRVQDFSETQLEIIQICGEIAGTDQFINNAEPHVNEDDLTTSRLSERKSHLEELENEKNLRLQKVHDHITSIHELSKVMSLDFGPIIDETRSSFVDTGHGQSKSPISDDSLSKWAGVVNSLKQEKEERLKQIQYLGRSLVELWDLLGTPIIDQLKFEDVVGYIGSSVDEVWWAGSLSKDAIKQATVEVFRLRTLQGSKMSPEEQKEHDAYLKAVFAEEYPKKLITIFVKEDGLQERRGEVDINRSTGYFSFASDIQLLCPFPNDDENLPLVHISWPWFPLYGIAEYYTQTKEGDKKIEPLTMDWESFAKQLDYLVILPLGGNTNRIALQITNDNDKVQEDLAIFKSVVTNSDLLFTAIYYYSCSSCDNEPAGKDRRPKRPWQFAICSYYDQNNEVILPPYEPFSEEDDEVEVEVEEESVVGDGADDDFIKRLVRIVIKESY